MLEVKLTMKQKRQSIIDAVALKRKVDPNLHSPLISFIEQDTQLGGGPKGRAGFGLEDRVGQEVL